MVSLADLLSEAHDSLGCRQGFAIGLLGDNAHKAILRQRAGCPTVVLIGTPPFLGAVEMDMVRLQQRQKKIHIKQRTHPQTSSSSHFLTISDVMICPVRGKSRKPLR